MPSPAGPTRAVTDEVREREPDEVRERHEVPGELQGVQRLGPAPRIGTFAAV